MVIIETERFEVTATDGSVAVNYQYRHVVHSIVVIDPPDPIVMGPIIDDADEVTS